MLSLVLTCETVSINGAIVSRPWKSQQRLDLMWKWAKLHPWATVAVMLAAVIVIVIVTAGLLLHMAVSTRRDER